jgi:NADH-quinone oxidoreductase subunit G
MPKIVVDQRTYEVKEDQNLLQASLSLGLNLPYFCWHPALGSVGACRQCAVKQFRNEQDTTGRIVMACMTPASEGARISIEDPEAREFRASVIEWMMIDHPHDCPICDEGGECHLQDMTVMTGHDYRRFRGRKRTYENQDLGPFVNQEMNRCIQCYRCVRFYRDFAGGRDFDAFLLHSNVFYGRKEDGTLENEFSGNLVEVCPTGVFTDKSLKSKYTRKWDLRTSPSICTGCSLGCNIIPGERYGVLRRIRNRYNGEVNGYFLCDRGRYGYEFVNSENRILHPQVSHSHASVSRASVLDHLLNLITAPGGKIGIGSPRASLEANFALRSLVGPENFYSGVSKLEATLVNQAIANLQNGPVRSPSLREVEQADAVLVLGEDVTNTAPMLALALRQAARRKPQEMAQQQHIPAWDDFSVRNLIQNEHGPVFIATPGATRLDEVATHAWRGAADDVARLGFAIAHLLDASAPAVAGLSSEMSAFAGQVAAALKDAKKPLVVSGCGAGSLAVIQAAANVAWGLAAAGKAAGLMYALPEANSMGLGLMGAGNLEDAIQAVKDRQIETVIVVENDLYRHLDAIQVTDLLHSARHVVAIDHLKNETSTKAEVVLPAATFADGEGTLVNNEGRAQRYYKVLPPKEDVQDSWRWVCDLMSQAGRGEALHWQNQEDVMAAIAHDLPVFEPILEIAPPADFRIDGLKIPREPSRASGRTAILAKIKVSEPKPPQDPDAPLSFTMEGTVRQPPAALLSNFWAPGWNSIQALNKFQDEIAGPLRGGDAGKRLIEPKSSDKPAYFSDIPAAFSAREGEWQVIPLVHIFGSEELSVLSPGVAQRAPQPYLGLNLADIEKLRLNAENIVELQIAGMSFTLRARPMPDLPSGLAGMPVGLPGLHGVVLPAWSRLRAVAESVEGGEPG